MFCIMEIENNQVQPEPQNQVCQPTEEKAPVMSVGEWMVTLLILFIPIVNIIMLFIWGFGGGVNKTKANYCKASLIWVAIGLILWFAVFSSIVGGMLAAMS